MSKFDEWCDDLEVEMESDDHAISLLETDEVRRRIGRDILAEAVPSHYASKARLANMVERLGKTGLANYIRTKLPTGKSMRSGDLGEILATTYIEEVTVWDKGVRKLRWKDHREMAMRGDDLLAVGIDEEDAELVFLKGESKSRATLRNSVVTQARKALNANGGLPTPHALAFLSDRLHEDGETAIADMIDAVQYGEGVHPSRVSHMIFTFSGNNPTDALTTDIMSYEGKIPQWSVGLHLEEHQAFIAAVYEKASDNGDD